MKNTLKLAWIVIAVYSNTQKKKMQIGINNVEEKRMEIKDLGKY